MGCSLGAGPGQSHRHILRGAALQPDACLDHRSRAKLANKGNGTAARVGYTVNGLLENRHRLLSGIDVEVFRSTSTQAKMIRGVAPRLGQPVPPDSRLEGCAFHYGQRQKREGASELHGNLLSEAL